MAAEEEKSSDFYAVLGLKKECSASELRDAYKRLALRWHPDRCSASGNSKLVDEAKNKFQAIQEAYSVLSDENKRFLYDVGAYESDDDDDEKGMGDFLGEMAAMMSQAKPNENAQQCFEDLQMLFDKMFGKEMESFSISASQCSSSNNAINSMFPPYSSDFSSSSSNSNSNDSSCHNKRNSAEMSSGNDNNVTGFQMDSGDLQDFCVGAEGSAEASKGRGGSGGSGKRRTKQRFNSARIPA